MKQKSLVWPVPTMKNVETILQFPRWGNVPIAEGLIDLWITEQARREWSPTRKRDVTVVGHVSLKKGSITQHIPHHRPAQRPPMWGWQTCFRYLEEKQNNILDVGFLPTHAPRLAEDI